MCVNLINARDCPMWWGRGYAHARQFKRIRQVIKRQHTIVGQLQREVGRKMNTLSQAVQETPGQTLYKVKRLVTQTGSRKAVSNRAKLYSWHAPEVACISGSQC